METHHIHPELLKHKVRVLVVGCGGNGSAIAAGLPYLHQALLAYGHPDGIHVTLLDPDAISSTNCVRQPFSQSEIGLYKSVVLANRLNLFWGLDWDGIPERLDTRRRLDGVDIVIGCVDTRTARAAIAKVRRGLERSRLLAGPREQCRQRPIRVGGATESQEPQAWPSTTNGVGAFPGGY